MNMMEREGSEITPEIPAWQQSICLLIGGER